MGYEEKESVTLDEALKRVGGYRRWNIIVFCMLGMSTCGPLCWQGLSIVFIGWEPPHHCTVPLGSLPNESIPMTTDGQMDKCLIYTNSSLGNGTTDCEDWTYQDEGYSTIVTEFDLVCSNNYLSELSQTIFMLGSLFAEFVVSYLTDRFGRKKIHIAAHIGLAISGSSVFFVKTYTGFVVLRTISGVFLVATTLSGILLMLELFDSDRRAVVGVGLEFLWVAAYLPYPFLAMYVVNWRTLQLIVSLFSLVWILYIWVMVESPEWLTAYKRYDEAEACLEKMAKFNGLPNPNFKLKQEDDILLKDKGDDSENKKDVNMSVPVSTLLIDPKLRIHLAISCFLWFVNCVVYYGLMLATPSMRGNRFINFFLSGLVEIPSYVISFVVVDRIGRRIPTIAFHFVAGIALAIIPFVPEQTASGTELYPLVLTLAFIAKFGITGSFTVIILLTREVFPTNIRGTASGAFAVLGRIGSMIAPFMAYFGKVSFWLPSIIFATTSILGGVSTLGLPETVRKAMPMTQEDMYEIFYPKIHEKKFGKKEENANSVKM